MKKIELEIPEGKRAEWIDGVLKLVDEKPKDITERIKMFDDAVGWCKKNGSKTHRNIVAELENICYHLDEDVSADLLAYLKLRIITCALNEGWEPKEFGQEVYVPHFAPAATSLFLPVKHGYCGDLAKKLCFKSPKLADYAAFQFRDIYADFCGRKKGGKG